MLHKMVFPGKYIQGAGAVGELPTLVKLFGSRGLILASATVHKRVLPESGIELHANALFMEPFRGECCEKELSRVAAIIREKNVMAVIMGTSLREACPSGDGGGGASGVCFGNCCGRASDIPRGEAAD